MDTDTLKELVTSILSKYAAAPAVRYLVVVTAGVFGKIGVDNTQAGNFWTGVIQIAIPAVATLVCLAFGAKGRKYLHEKMPPYTTPTIGVLNYTCGSVSLYPTNADPVLTVTPPEGK